MVFISFSLSLTQHATYIHAFTRLLFFPRQLLHILNPHVFFLYVTQSLRFNPKRQTKYFCICTGTAFTHIWTFDPVTQHLHIALA